MPEIKYVFTASGHDQVRRAYQTAADAEEKAAAAHERAAKKSKSAAQVAAESWKKAQETGAKNAARNQIKAYEEQQRAVARAAQNEAKAAERARQQQAKNVERFANQEAKAVERARQKEAKAAEQAKKQEARAAERTAREVAREEDKQRKRRIAEAEQHKKDHEARYRRYRETALKARQEDEARKLGKKPDPKGGKGGKGGKDEMSTWDIIRYGAVGSYGARAANAAVDIVKDAYRSVADLQEAANRTSINARGAGAAYVDPADLIKDAQAAALGSPGQKAAEIMQAMQSFVSMTGELETGRQSAATFATVASATGSNIGDVSKAAASIYNQFGLKTNAEMQDVLAALTFQGKQGAFELSDAAAQFQRLAAAGASFGLTGAKGVKTIGGLAQIARTGTGSAEQTTTAIENIFSNLIAKSKILKGQGVNVFDKSGKTRDVTDVLIESIVKAGKGNFEKKGQILQQVFGDQGIRGVRPLLAKYQAEFQGVRNRGGSEAEATAAGMKRLRDEIEKSVNAPGAWDEVQKDAAQAQKDISAQTTRAFEQVQAAITKGAMPALGAFSDALTNTVNFLIEKGIIDDPSDDEDVKRNRQTLDQMKAREAEMLAAGPMDEATFAEFAILQDAIKQAELRGMSDDEIQKKTNALYGKGGVMSDDDAAEADRLQAELTRRGVAADAEVAARGPMSRDQFDQMYYDVGDGGFLARTRRDLFANSMVGKGQEMPEWMYSLSGESDEERFIREQYRERHAERSTSLLDRPLVETSDAERVNRGAINESFTDVAAAAKIAADALKEINAKGQASITGVTGPG